LVESLVGSLVGDLVGDLDGNHEGKLNKLSTTTYLNVLAGRVGFVGSGFGFNLSTRPEFSGPTFQPDATRIQKFLNPTRRGQSTCNADIITESAARFNHLL